MNKHLLIIEDSPPDLFILLHKLRLTLPNTHIQTSTSLNVKGEFDVIVTDLNLVGEAYGPEIVRTLTRKHPNTPIIGFSGIGNETVAKEYVSQGLYECFDKSNLKGLSALLEALLGELHD